MEALTKSCPKCDRPTCKNCMKSFPFSHSLCIECAAGVKTGLGGIRKDEEIF
jgi:predicted amidophosphoribosyltransferase